MHPTAIENSKNFFDTYTNAIRRLEVETVKVVEIGSQDVNGSLRINCPPDFSYVGVDFVVGKGVDVVLTDPYKLPFDDGSVDVVISSSCFEHSEMFWVLFLEILRIMKPAGLFYLNVPSNGGFHRWPVDCWRFYPDSGNALVTWAKYNHVDAALLESYTSTQIGDQWNDFVAVFLKSSDFINSFPDRILDKKQDYYNGLVNASSDFKRYESLSEDQKKLSIISQLINNQLKIV